MPCPETRRASSSQQVDGQQVNHQNVLTLLVGDDQPGPPSPSVLVTPPSPSQYLLLPSLVALPCALNARVRHTSGPGTFARIGFMRTQGAVEECLLARMSTYKIADRRRLFQIFQALKEGNFLRGHDMTSWADHGAASTPVPESVH